MNKLDANFTIFILFFGLALIEAIKEQDWLKSVLFLALGAMFLWADRKKTE
jgi:hypothetical protein